ncbi:MAG TPA: hypothetical protein VGF38_18815 [Ktedonobacterales bacterium]|jgi:hypothetical protein
MADGDVEMTLQVFTTTLWPDEEHPLFGKGVYVAPVDKLANVTEGQRVNLREEPEFEITAIMHKVTAPSGAEWWFGAEIEGSLHYLTELSDASSGSHIDAE